MNNMIKINQKQLVSDGKYVKPLMHIHNLTVKKEAQTFTEGEIVKCYVTQYSDGRFAVFSSSGATKTKYHVFESEQELNDTFDEAN